MLVYGDAREFTGTHQRVLETNRRLDAVERMAPGLARHAQIVSALIDLGQLLQSIADADFARCRCDRRTSEVEQLTCALYDASGAVCRSWDSGFESIGPLPRVNSAGEWPAQTELRSAEGFAFYAVYPEAYIDAARRLNLAAPPRVIGIRSIGSTLAAVVAAALGAPPPVTLRPFGDPQAREVAVDASLESELLEGGAHYVIVDEGPGRSGSSFAAVADWLRHRGIGDDRIACLPSHSGDPGPDSTDQRRTWWRRLQRQPGDFGSRWPQLIADWCNHMIGPLGAAPLDLSAGQWRRLYFASEDDWPAAVPAWERRKFLVDAGGARLLVKFAGLGRIGEHKLALARALDREGLVAQPVALVHGFLVERWCEDAVPLLSDSPIAEIGHYIGIRARLLPAVSGSGASVERLLAMARCNIALEFGAEATSALNEWTRRARDLERRIVRVRTDNRMDRHKWLRTTSGALVKTDALDHHQGHDLIGCQDFAWDCAGALVEFEVGEDSAEPLIRAAEQSAGREVDRDLLQLYRIAYLAFRLGHTRLGSSIVCDSRERRRLAARAGRYAAELRHLLESSSASTRRESLIG